MLDQLCPFSKRYIYRAFHRDYVGVEEPNPGLMESVVYYCQIPIFLLLSIPCRIIVVQQLYETIARCWSRGILGFFIRNVYYKNRIGKMGQDVFMDQAVNIFYPKNLFIGNNTHIDVGCCFTCGSGKLEIGDNVHISSHCIINSKPSVKIGNGVGISAHCLIYGSTQTYRDENGNRVSGSPMMPMDKQNVKMVGIEFEECAFLGVNTSVLPGAHLGKYCVIGANSVVNSKIPDYAVAVGCPAKVKSVQE